MSANGWAAEEAGQGVHRTQVGDSVVLTLLDGVVDMPAANLRGIEEAAAVSLVAAAPNPPAPIRLRSTITAYAVRRGGRTAVIDAGGGSFMGPGAGRLPDSLRAAGIDPAEVDTVLMTHLHPDHAFGLIHASGEALFPNATLRLSVAEERCWLGAGSEAALPEGQRRYHGQILRSLAPYRDRLSPFTGDEVFPGITPVPLPGHTPGHTGFRIGGGDSALLVWGDIVHVPEIQGPRPDVTVVFDLDPGQAAATRRRLLEEAAVDGLHVTGMHTRLPGTARVERRGSGFAIVPDPL